MPRDYHDDDRPRRRRPRDEDDRPARSRRRPADEDDRPRRRPPRDEDDEDYAPPRKKKSHVGLILGILAGVFVLCCGGGGFLAWYLSDKVGLDSRDRQVSSNNLKQIGLGIHNYHDRLGSLPNNIYGPDGRPLLSWRVHILPYVEQEGLYRQFKLDEPWDGPNNRRLTAQIPSLYTTPDTGSRAGEGKTFYREFTNRGAVFQKPQRPGEQLRITDITDGLSNTVFAVEAAEAVEWTKPDEFDFSFGRPLPPLGAGRAGDQVLVLMGDGSVRSVKKTLPEPTWRALIYYADGNAVPNF